MGKSADAFRTIGEVSDTLDTPAHVLRFWESKFTQVRPVKRAGGRRYYRPDDLALLAGIKVLLHEQGMTIKGVQKVLRDRGVKHVIALGEDEGLPPSHDGAIDHSAAETFVAPRRPASAEVIALPLTRPAEARVAVLGPLLTVPPHRMERHRDAIVEVARRLRSVHGRLAPAIRDER